ncbi:MAG: hypothetical protein HUJ29_09475 [Gammaproteobacteria bacterium]|nr:hypothetical protein [Gammaproteobacteria bacterium]
MTENIFQSILFEHVENFKYSFKKASRERFYDPDRKLLRHAGEFGRLRENVTKEFIRYCIPHYLEIGTGFVINHEGDISTQIDLVVYERNETPLIQDSEKQFFYPAETVCAIGEVKSVLKKEELKVALNKMAKNKVIREKVSNTDCEIVRAHGKRELNFDPVKNDSDRILSFLICERFDFNTQNLVNEINNYYECEVENRNKHNMILSISDGLVLYNFPGTEPTEVKYSPVPEVNGEAMKNIFLQPTESLPNIHFSIFATYLFSRTKSISIISPDLAHYFDRNVLGSVIIEG